MTTVPSILRTFYRLCTCSSQSKGIFYAFGNVIRIRVFSTVHQKYFFRRSFLSSSSALLMFWTRSYITFARWNFHILYLHWIIFMHLLSSFSEICALFRKRVHFLSISWWYHETWTIETNVSFFLFFCWRLSKFGGKRSFSEPNRYFNRSIRGRNFGWIFSRIKAGRWKKNAKTPVLRRTISAVFWCFLET